MFTDCTKHWLRAFGLTIVTTSKMLKSPIMITKPVLTETFATQIKFEMTITMGEKWEADVFLPK